MSADETPVTARASHDDVAAQLAPLLESLEVTDAPAELVQLLLERGVRLYYELRRRGGDFGPFPEGDAVPATEVMVAVSNMLQAADVDVFELGMWKNLTGS